jgi:hypothetical protein
MSHEVERMGLLLRREVERQLLDDLTHYRGEASGLTIDWSDPCQEGHCTDYMGGKLESLSDVRVVDTTGAMVADGWMDFVHGGGSNPLFVFWLFLRLRVNGSDVQVKAEPTIPPHVWSRLPDTSKDLCVVDGAWEGDSNVKTWSSRRGAR